jgi:hypothetical protein
LRFDPFARRTRLEELEMNQLRIEKTSLHEVRPEVHPTRVAEVCPEVLPEVALAMFSEVHPEVHRKREIEMPLPVLSMMPEVRLERVLESVL